MSHRDQSCTRKQKMRSKRQAKDAIAGMVRALGLHRSIFTFYPCPYCGKWHVGHRRPDLDQSNSAIDITSEGFYA